MPRAQRALRHRRHSCSSRNRYRHEPSGRDLAASLLHCWRASPPASPLRLEGVMTHLFAADEADGRVTERPTCPHRARPGPSPEPPVSIPSGSTSGNSAALLAGSGAHHRGTCRASWDEGPPAPGPRALWSDAAFDPAFRSLQSLRSSPQRARASSPCSVGNRASSACGQFLPAPSSATTAPLSPPSPCGSRWSPRAMPTASTGELGNHFSLLVRGQRAPLGGPHQHGSGCSRCDRRFPASLPATKS